MPVTGKGSRVGSQSFGVERAIPNRMALSSLPSELMLSSDDFVVASPGNAAQRKESAMPDELGQHDRPGSEHLHPRIYAVMVGLLLCDGNDN
jgi:hypothetical protein